MDGVVAVERAMVRIRRLQQRRTLARVSARAGDRVDPTLTAVVDAVEQGGGAATVSGVAAALDVDQPRASRLVTGAVEAGLVARTADQADGRRARLELTAAGAAHAERVHRLRRAMFAEAMAGWSPGQVDTFARLLTRFVDAFAELSAE
ncbi:MAG TPA: MarR family winged helix-turn-helix transcriptional regulator [Actinophytocola sp.]|uniref:MarR family winged helix-turn-helix transcriptional regulator n=1 Tax=Actinophytocola sp. TaxID=1872138 RepID=UPI002DBDCAB8|nr:MarR family winged helix-turn-helix transcriptional regulator [Actinophytocola sp.]HEU5473091.1 MarR family winged helix-turn-helix transcriptional regulator [Actinophytocola sp.]